MSPESELSPYDEAVGVFYSPSVVVIYSRRFYYILHVWIYLCVVCMQLGVCESEGQQY